MWYAPIGSLEYVVSLHNDILIKRYILSEQRLKQQKATRKQSEQGITWKSGEEGSAKGKGTKGEVDTRKTRIKGCVVNVKINRSFRKTSLDVVTYDSTKTRGDRQSFDNQ